MSDNLPKLIVIAGPTASGKTALSLQIAKKFGGEIISADSRQAYKGMNIGTAKITKKEMRDIPHYLLDVASPKRRFTVAQYKKLALTAIKKILKKPVSKISQKSVSKNFAKIMRPHNLDDEKFVTRKIPILCGGTGFYIQTVIDDTAMPEVPPNWKLRKKLEEKSTEELFAMLKKLDRRRAAKIDKNNPRRLIRAIEIVKKTGNPIPALKAHKKFNILMLGIKKSPEEIKQRIKKRLVQRFKQGMIAEVKRLHANGVSWKRLEEFGLEYRWIARYLQGKLPLQEMIEKLQKDSEHYAKRQMTWFKKDKRINWVKNYRGAELLVKDFIRWQ